jgi:hypothetical protein
MTIEQRIETGKGAAIRRLLILARKAERRGQIAKAAELIQRAEFLKTHAPTIWG